MKIPAIRSKMGEWTYYVTTLTFQQVSDYVSRVDEELHKSESLKDLIQRSITNNQVSIKEYILNQPEVFFNSLVLAVYDDYPDWKEIEVTYDNFETYQLGILEFPSTHKIFPVDGQHRVEGIKSALLENPELKTQQIGAIFIGHKNDLNGMRRTRRLFSTLNRYAKPVTMDDIIALDEDDSVAIVTRELLETFDLFTGSRVAKSKNKAILDTDKESITSIITLYQCNTELLKLFRAKRKKENPNVIRDNKSLNEYLKFRPREEEITLFQDFCIIFWNSFSTKLNCIITYLKNTSTNPALEFRNKEDGGNLIFRPVGLLPFIQASIEIHKRTGDSFELIFEELNKLDFTLDNIPWKNVLWNSHEKTMVMGSSGITKLLFFYMYGSDIIRPSELRNLKNQYADRINSEDIQNILEGIPKLV